MFLREIVCMPFVADDHSAMETGRLGVSGCHFCFVSNCWENTVLLVLFVIHFPFLGDFTSTLHFPPMLSHLSHFCS